ncbi:DUF6339 family protein [Aeromonas hydrophila]|uniref:DUF6339 family protein n=1 Tax=Aeromonas hydrophila TaxID=644 RepID=UPI001115E311|nr:DUF6339 family protein [Aeromonas hydrophila]
MRVLLLPRLKAHGVTTIIEQFRNEYPSARDGVNLLNEYASLKSSAPSGGVRADKVSVEITSSLRDIARDSGFPTNKSQSAKAMFDQKAAIFLGQREELKTGEALRDDVWAFMTTVLAPDIVMWRFTDKNRERFSGGVRNTFQRLWVRGTVLDRGGDHSNRWELINELTEDAMVQIFERASISSNYSLAKELAESWLKTERKFGRGPMEDIMRSAIKIVRVKNQIIDLSYLSSQELSLVVSKAFSFASAELT